MLMLHMHLRFKASVSVGVYEYFDNAKVFHSASILYVSLTKSEYCWQLEQDIEADC
jgi:hypothetical protein